MGRSRVGKSGTVRSGILKNSYAHHDTEGEAYLWGASEYFSTRREGVRTVARLVNSRLNEGT